MGLSSIQPYVTHAEKCGAECVYESAETSSMTAVELGQLALQLRRVGFTHFKRKHPSPFSWVTFSWDDKAERVKVGKWALTREQREEMVLGLLEEGVPDNLIRRYADCAQDYIARRRAGGRLGDSDTESGNVDEAIERTEGKHKCRCDLRKGMSFAELQALGGGCSDPQFACPRLTQVRNLARWGAAA